MCRVEKLKISFHQHSENDIKNMTFKFEDKIYSMATDKVNSKHTQISRELDLTQPCEDTIL